jgi:hypothetical protein
MHKRGVLAGNWRALVWFRLIMAGNTAVYE